MSKPYEELKWTGPLEAGWAPTPNTLYVQVEGSTTRRLARTEDLITLGFVRVDKPVRTRKPKIKPEEKS